MKDFAIGKKVIIRSDRAGVFFGTLKERDGQEVVLQNVRRIWKWVGACSLSQLAEDGIAHAAESKVSVEVPEMCILAVVEILPCSDKSIVSIDGIRSWKI